MHLHLKQIFKSDEMIGTNFYVCITVKNSLIHVTVFSRLMWLHGNICYGLSQLLLLRLGVTKS